MEAKYKEPHPGKIYDFARFTNGIAEEDKIIRKKKIDLTKEEYQEDIEGNIDPIRMDNTDISRFIQ